MSYIRDDPAQFPGDVGGLVADQRHVQAGHRSSVQGLGEQRDGRSRLRRAQRQLRAVGQQAQAVEEDEVEERFVGLDVGEQRASRHARLGGNLRRAGAAVAKPTEHLDGRGRYGG